MSVTDRQSLIDRYRDGAAAVDAVLAGATDADLDRAPAGGGWTARQVIHHLADSETNAYIRLRRLIAEDAPHIVGYDEERWAATLRYDRPIAAALAVVHAVRTASLELLGTLTDADWARAGTHSERGSYSVMTWLETYARHCHDHAAQIREAIAAR